MTDRDYRKEFEKLGEHVVWEYPNWTHDVIRDMLDEIDRLRAENERLNSLIRDMLDEISHFRDRIDEEAKILRIANNAIYFADSHDYKAALYSILKVLGADISCPTFLDDEPQPDKKEQKQPTNEEIFTNGYEAAQSEYDDEISRLKADLKQMRALVETHEELKAELKAENVQLKAEVERLTIEVQACSQDAMGMIAENERLRKIEKTAQDRLKCFKDLDFCGRKDPAHRCVEMIITELEWVLNGGKEQPQTAPATATETADVPTQEKEGE